MTEGDISQHRSICSKDSAHFYLDYFAVGVLRQASEQMTAGAVGRCGHAALVTLLMTGVSHRLTCHSRFLRPPLGGSSSRSGGESQPSQLMTSTRPQKSQCCCWCSVRPGHRRGTGGTRGGHGFMLPGAPWASRVLSVWICLSNSPSLRCSCPWRLTLGHLVCASGPHWGFGRACKPCWRGGGAV